VAVRVVSEQAAPVHYGGFTLAAVTLGLFLWPVAFNIGAFEVIFFRDVLGLVAASTIVLLVTFAVPSDVGRRVWIDRLLLAGPVLWVAVALLFHDSLDGAERDRVLAVLGLLVLVTSVPFALKTLIRLLVPQATDLGSRRLLMWLVIILATVSALGWVAGANHRQILLCEDFAIAGEFQPEDCERGSR
jgi:hypothetical protein